MNRATDCVGFGLCILLKLINDPIQMTDCDPSLSRVSDSERLRTALHNVFEEVADVLSVTSVDSTATASDLSGAGRTLGNIYGILGKQLEKLVNRLAVRFGFGPDAIERRVLDRFNPCHGLTKKGDKRLRTELLKLIKYTGSDIASNRLLAYRAIVSIAIAHPYLRRLLRELDATKALGLACALEEMSGLRDNLLSPSRKALICLLETELTTVGGKWTLLASAFRDLGKRYMAGNDKSTGPSRHFFDAHTSYYQALVKYVGSNSPEQSWLALRFFADAMRVRVHYGRHKPAYVVVATTPADNAQIRSLFQRQLIRNHQLHIELAQRIHRVVLRDPENVDWTVIELAVLQLSVQDFTMSSSLGMKKCGCSVFVDDIIAKFSGNFSPDVALRIQILRNTSPHSGNNLATIEGALSESREPARTRP